MLYLFASGVVRSGRERHDEPVGQAGSLNHFGKSHRFLHFVLSVLLFTIVFALAHATYNSLFLPHLLLVNQRGSSWP